MDEAESTYKIFDRPSVGGGGTVVYKIEWFAAGDADFIDHRIDKPHQQHERRQPVTSLMTSLNRRRPENMKCGTITFEVASCIAVGMQPREIVVGR